jgi:acetolactate synthase I/II/III large subunit
MEAKRPLVVAGNGIVLAGARDEFVAFVEKYDLPVVFTYLTIDLLPTSHRLAIGRLGTKGDRAGNFAVHNCDLLIVLGSSLSVSVTGFRYELFAPNAKKIVVDIDPYEHKKGTVKVDKEYNVDLKEFFSWNMGLPYKRNISWTEICGEWTTKWPVYQDAYKDTSKGINMYLLMNSLGALLKGNNYVVSDAGSAYFVTSQSLSMNGLTRYITSGAQADMGFTLPCAVGVAIANPEANVIGITGDGSFQMNIQELQTIVNYKLNIKICILNNGGYLSIRNTMDKYFESRYYGTDEKSGLTLPDAERIAYGYNIKFKRLEGDGFEKELKKCLDLKGPVIIEVMCPFKQDIVPCSSAKEVEGKMVSQPLWNMYPFVENIENEFV